MKKIFLLVSVLILCSCSKKSNNFQSVLINDKIIKVDVADTLESRYKGLSGKQELCADCGMLFVFPDKAVRTFVMRSMNFPLDIIWIDGDEIKKVSKNLPPEGPNPAINYSSDVPANYVLEVNGGFADENGIKYGDKFKFN